MDNKKSPNRSKRQGKASEENYWDCSVCTYRNTAEAFKCLMCDVRKGTSTRKPRINPHLAARYSAPPPTAPATSARRRGSSTSACKRVWPRLKGVDRSSPQTREITVNNVTVVITEYRPKKRQDHHAGTAQQSSPQHNSVPSDSASS